jgi:hypothetical protein
MIGLLRTLVCIAGLAGLCGCAGYHLGPVNRQVAGARSIQVLPIANHTIEPRLSEPVTHSLRRRLQQDGTYRLATRDDGDVILSGSIKDFRRSELSFQPRDIITIRDYQVTIVASITAVERLTGRVLLERDVSGRTTLRVGDDLASAERQAIPLLAEDLARNVTTLLVEGSW